ncbi:MAG TPA: hypothetical protein VF096_12755 [Azonexus sp.]
MNSHLQPSVDRPFWEQRMLGTHGRLDDMLIIKGVNIFPSDVEAIAHKDHALTGGYKLIVERENHLDRLTVEIELSAVAATNDAELAARFAGHLKSVTAVAARIVILPPETLLRATHKARRVEDRRQHVWS